MVGEGVAFGKTDSNIAHGLPVDVAVRDILIAMHLKRNQIIIGNAFHQIFSKIAMVSETVYSLGGSTLKNQQVKALKEHSKED
jgi:hypothetical protein